MARQDGCRNCGRRTARANLICTPCRESGQPLPGEHESDFALEHGRWVRHGLVMRWEATPPPPPKPKLERPKEPKPLRGVDPLLILDAVADHYGITVAEMHEPSPGGVEAEHLTNARHVARWLLRQTGMTLAAVGRVTSRDHSTALHSVQRVIKRKGLMEAALEVMHELLAEHSREADERAGYAA